MAPGCQITNANMPMHQSGAINMQEHGMNRIKHIAANPHIPPPTNPPTSCANHKIYNMSSPGKIRIATPLFNRPLYTMLHSASPSTKPYRMKKYIVSFMPSRMPSATARPPAAAVSSVHNTSCESILNSLQWNDSCMSCKLTKIWRQRGSKQLQMNAGFKYLYNAMNPNENRTANSTIHMASTIQRWRITTQETYLALGGVSNKPGRLPRRS